MKIENTKSCGVSTTMPKKIKMYNKKVWIEVNKDNISNQHTTLQILDLNGKLIKIEKH